MPHSKKRSFIRSSPLAYVVVPCAGGCHGSPAGGTQLCAAAALPDDAGLVLDNTTASQPQDLLAEAGTVIDGGAAEEAAAQPETIPFSSITYPTLGDR